MADKKSLYEKMDLYKKKCKEKGFWQNEKPDAEAEMAGMLALTKDSVSVFGSTEKAFDFLLSIINECESSQDLLDKIADKLGLN